MSVFEGWISRFEAALVDSLQLEPIPLGPLARLEGRFRETPIELVARAWRGPSVRYARFVVVKGGPLDIGNVLALPALDRAVPVLGADLVDVGRGSALVVADLSPMLDGDAREEQLRMLESALPEAPRDELPAWAARWFSSRALSTRVAPAALPTFEATVARYVSAFAQLSSAAPRVTDPRTGQAQAAYLQTHREEDRGLSMLGRLFGDEAAVQLLTNVMFPLEVP